MVGKIVRITQLCVFLFAMTANVHPCAAAGDVGIIEGRWITFDHDSNQKRAVIQVVQTGSRVSGRIVDFFAKPGEDQDPICENCQGSDYRHPIRGLTILEMVAEEDGRNFRGTIFDPEEGRTYRCVATLEPDGRQLRLRGFVGLEIFGRTETWFRPD